MNKHLMDIIENELAAFRGRGGDDLVAEYYEGEEDVEDAEVHLFRRSDGRRHSITISDGTFRGESYYCVSGIGYEDRELLGIACTNVELDLRKNFHDPESQEEARAFVGELSSLLDKHKGQFAPVRGEDVAVHPVSPRVLEIISRSIPDDGSVTVHCNVVPELLPDGGEDEFDDFGDPVDREGDDCFTFHDADGAQVDLWIVTENGAVQVMNSDGLVGRFSRDNDFLGLRDAIEDGLSVSAAPAL